MLDLHPDDGAPHDRRVGTDPPPSVLELRMQAPRGRHLDPPVAGIVAGESGVGRGPGGRVSAGEPGPVAPRLADGPPVAA